MWGLLSVGSNAAGGLASTPIVCVVFSEFSQEQALIRGEGRIQTAFPHAAFPALSGEGIGKRISPAHNK